MLYALWIRNTSHIYAGALLFMHIINFCSVTVISQKIFKYVEIASEASMGVYCSQAGQCWTLKLGLIWAISQRRAQT